MQLWNGGPVMESTPDAVAAGLIQVVAEEFLNA